MNIQDKKVNEALANLQIASLNEMQLAALEVCKKGKSLVLLSPTGSGKTLAFLLPVLLNLKPEIKNDIQALIVVPSRELAIQIEQVFKAMQTGFKIMLSYGGHDIKVEINNLVEAPAVVIATPGRLAQHIRQKSIFLNNVHTLVYDEFDKSLELGFQEDLKFISTQLHSVKQRILTSATQAESLPDFAGVEKAQTINFLTDAIPPQLDLKLVKAIGTDKLEALLGLVCKQGTLNGLIFCNHREAVERISEILTRREIQHGSFHGGMEQIDREKSLIKFRNGSHRILITTDLASRGLDIPELGYIVHYQVPHQESAFTHRNGRTARMFASGEAFLVLAEEEKLPLYLQKEIEILELPAEAITPPPTEFETVYVSAGKKDKINKIDLVGFFIQTGSLEKEDIGKIEVLDFSSFVAVKRDKVHQLLFNTKNQKIKKKAVKVDVSN